ncbi:MAG: glycosyltransferase family 87 protein [Thermoleophilia bacterium]
MIPPVSPVRKSCLFISLFILALLFSLNHGVSPAVAQLESNLSEQEAKHLAMADQNVSMALEKHPELERHANYDHTLRRWNISWANPYNDRKLISVVIDDLNGNIISSDINGEAWFEVLPATTENDAIDVASSQPEVESETKDREEITRSASLGTDSVWTVKIFSASDEVAEVLVDDASGSVNEVRVGPQVAWQMARGYKGAFGRIVNEPYIWMPLCLLFLVPFVDIRRPLRIFHLDLVMLLAFTVSHYFFNQGEIFKSVPLAYPPLVYLFLRLGWIGWRRSSGRGTPASGSLGENSDTIETGVTREPHINFNSTILLIGLASLLLFRIVLNIADSNVVDVGYSGVIGAHRILEGTTPYGNMPADDGNGDTYGPMNYLVYVPFEKVLPWSGEWDDLPAAHAAAIFFDMLAVAGMYTAGRCLARGRPFANKLGLALAYGWAAYPYTTYVLNCNVNDAIVAAFIIWGFVFLQSAPLAGVLLGFAAQIKFFPAMLGPAWASFPRAMRGWWRRTLFVSGFLLAIASTLLVIFMGDGTFGLFWERTIRWQIGRDSPFSIWGQYPERLAGAQRIGQYLLVALSLGSYFWPFRKNMVQVAAISASLILGFQIVQTHWFYLYIPWFFPLALIAFLTARCGSNPKNSAIMGSCFVQTA